MLCSFLKAKQIMFSRNLQKFILKDVLTSHPRINTSKGCKNVICSMSYLARFSSTSSKENSESTLEDKTTENGNRKSPAVDIRGLSYALDSMSNVTDSIRRRVERQLHLQQNHPLRIIKEKIEAHFYQEYRSRYGGTVFACVDNLSPVVTIEQNFDSLLVPVDHVSRHKNDNYYINSSHMLRAHTSAHQRDLIKSGWDAFLVTGDVYRRDEIDRTHFPVFHQMEGVRIYSNQELFGEQKDIYKIFEADGRKTNDKQSCHSLESSKMVELNLKNALEKLMVHLFGDDIEMRWVDAYFPFTHPSWELEIRFADDWVEMLGCGVVEHGILEKGGASDKIGWAFGLGLERLAMKLFNIPDIRLFWSEDQRFLQQFDGSTIVSFKPFSKFPPTFKDVSFWLQETQLFSPNDLFEVVRDVAGDIVEEMKCVDEFISPKSGQTSMCYRITYRSMDRTLTDTEVNAIQDKVRQRIVEELCVVLR